MSAVTTVSLACSSSKGALLLQMANSSNPFIMVAIFPPASIVYPSALYMKTDLRLPMKNCGMQVPARWIFTARQKVIEKTVHKRTEHKKLHL